MAARAIASFAAWPCLLALGTAVAAADPSPGKLPESAIARLGDNRLRHAAPANCLTFLPDSRQIITGGQDQRLRVWDVQTGAAVRSVEVSYSPMSLRFTHDGARLAVAAGYGSHLRFLYPETLEESDFATGTGNEFALSESGKLVATVASDTLTVSEIDTALPKLEIPVVSPTGYRSAFHPDGKSIAVANPSGKVTLFKVAGGKPILTLNHGGPINGLVMSTDGKRLVTGGDGVNGTLKIWRLDRSGDAKNVKPVMEVKGVSRPRAWFGADRIAAAGIDGAGVYDLASKRWAGFARGVTGEWAVSPDEKYVAAIGGDSLRVRIWELASGKQLHSENDTFPNVALLAPIPDCKSLFFLAGDVAYRWSMDKSEVVGAGRLPSSAIVAASGRGRLAIATPREVLIYDDFAPAKDLNSKPSRTLSEHAASPRAVAVSSDGRRVAYSGEAERVIVADAATGKAIRVLPVKTVGLGLAFTRDGSKLAVVGRDGFLRLWPIDAEGGEDSDVWRVRLQRAPRAAVAFSPDGTMVAATSATMIKVVNPVTGELIAQLDRSEVDDGVFQHVAFSPDSRLIVTGAAGLSGTVQVYDIARRTVIRRFKTSLGSIHRLAVFPDGTRAVSAGAEEVITVWDLTGRTGPRK
jgi:WD40 repeat protein